MPDIDEDATNLQQSLAMAQMNKDEGTEVLIAAPHQFRANSRVSAGTIINSMRELKSALKNKKIPVPVRLGAYVRIDPELAKLLKQSNALTLANRGHQLLLELHHENYFPLDSLLGLLKKQGLARILSRLEPNRGIIKNPDVMRDVIEQVAFYT